MGKGSWKGSDVKSWYGGGYGGGYGSDDEVAAALLILAALKGGGGGKGWGKGKGIESSGKFKVDESGGVLGEFLGTIKSFNEWKCYGFIECPDLAAQGYESVFLHGDMKKGYKKGNIVRFTAFLTGEGKCQAKDLKSGLKGEGAAERPPRPTWGSSGKFTVDESGGVLGEFVGTIKSFVNKSCYGFIDCPALKAQAPNGIFLHGDMKKDYQVGNKVKFTAFLTKDGKCQAKDLKSGLK